MDWADEKKPDTIASFILHHGVRLDSRYGKLCEFSVMMAMVTRCHREGLSSEMLRIFCDTQPQHVYEVRLKASALARIARETRLDGDLLDFTLGTRVADLCSAAAVHVNGGHNGIVVTIEDGKNACRELERIDAVWTDQHF